MKHRGDVPDYSEERVEDLMKTYTHILETYEGKINPLQLFERLANSPAQRFWVSPERAAIILARMEKGDDLSRMGNTRREMFQEIYRRAQELRVKYPNMSIRQLAVNVIMQPAPKFYLTPASARVIVCKVRKKWYRKKNANLFRNRFSQTQSQE